MIAWIFGDSFVDNYFPHGNKKSWADILLENKGYKVKNYAMSGRSTDDAVFCLRDMTSQIDPEKDFVLFTLSNVSRFMTIDNIETKYIDTDRNTVDMWTVLQDFDSNTKVLNAMMKLGNVYSDRLKLSIHSNYAKRLLDDIGVKYKMICGHFELVEIKSNYVKDYMLGASTRTFEKQMLQYFDIENFMQFNSGYCLINDFFHFQIDKIINSNHPKKYKLKDYYKQWEIDYSKNSLHYNDEAIKFIKRINEMQEPNEDVFFDAWHLSINGHRQYAKYVEQYDWGI